MKHGKVFGEMVKFTDPVLFHGRVDIGTGASQPGIERQQEWLTRGLQTTVVPSRSHSSVIGGSHSRSASEPVAVAESIKAESKPARAADVLRQPIPKLVCKKLKLSGRLPRLLPVRVVPEQKPHPPERIELQVEIPPYVEQYAIEPAPSVFIEPAPSVFIEPAPSVFIEPAPSVFIEPAPSVFVEPYAAPPRKVVPEIPSHVEVKLIPTPKKRGPRYAAAPEESPEPPVTKPLKVIRKRKAEAPKIFETDPRPMPLAMLVGIETDSEDSNGSED